MTLTGHAPWDLTRGGRRSNGGKGDGWDAKASGPTHSPSVAPPLLFDLGRRSGESAERQIGLESASDG